jgi:hypothetical protein
MSILSKPSSAVHMSIIYITAGALIDIWSGIWCWYLIRNAPEGDASWFYCWGFILTGLALVVIGMTLGRIGRTARDAELPPVEVMATVAQVEKTAAAVAPVVAVADAPAPFVAAPVLAQPLKDAGSIPLVAAPGPAQLPPVVPVRHASSSGRS